MPRWSEPNLDHSQCRLVKQTSYRVSASCGEAEHHDGVHDLLWFTYQRMLPLPRSLRFRQRKLPRLCDRTSGDTLQSVILLRMEEQRPHPMTRMEFNGSGTGV